MTDEGWDRSAAAWLAQQGEDGDFADILPPGLGGVR